LVLFYLTIGLTINYSVRLVHCLFSSTSHFAVTTRLTGATRFCKYPLWLLRGISVFGGSSCISKYIVCCSVACVTDKRLIIGTALLGTALGSLLSGISLHCSSLSRYMGVSTSYIRRAQLSMEIVYALERSPLPSLYLGRVSGAIRASYSSYIIFFRAVILCFPLFLI